MRALRVLSFLIVSTCFLIPSSTWAQSRLSYGFKAGLNSSKIQGAFENGRYESTSGFHLGIILSYSITDLFGVKGEFMYSQKGGDFFYDGPSFFHLQDQSTNILAKGTRIMNVSISNDYLDFPFLLYGKFGPLELQGGINIGLLAGSTGVGQLRFTGSEPLFDEFTLNLDHQYYRDEAGEANFDNEEIVRIGASQLSLPKEIGAYYEYDEKDGSLFHFLDFGLNVGALFYFNEGLYIGGRANFGMLDVKRASTEIVYDTFDGTVPAKGDATDKQVSYQFSLGFSF
ncbi:MAG: outer membrane beta-barrel protein [Saprospiraceae bacterium]|nr:outer membrane beta-barrel protein [Saprospiraceae bacterium]